MSGNTEISEKIVLMRSQYLNTEVILEKILEIWNNYKKMLYLNFCQFLYYTMDWRTLTYDQ